VTPSPESNTTPVVLPVEYLYNLMNLLKVFKLDKFNTAITYKLRTACIEMYKAGTLKDSKKISAIFSLFLRGFSGASVNNTGCCNIIKNENIE
jgi:hypothetical protein